MAQFSTTRRLSYTPEQLFAIAADVESYPTFLPLCTGARVWNVEAESETRKIFEASLTVEYSKLGLKEEFASQVVCDAEAYSVISTSTQPPVKHLISTWRLEPDKRGGSRVHYEIDFQMSSRLLQMAMSAAFSRVVDKVIAAFENRARELYG